MYTRLFRILILTLLLVDGYAFVPINLVGRTHSKYNCRSGLCRGDREKQKIALQDTVISLPPVAAGAVAIAGFLVPYLILNKIIAPKLGLMEDVDEEEKRGDGYRVNGKYQFYPQSKETSAPYDITHQTVPYKSELDESSTPRDEESSE